MFPPPQACEAGFSDIVQLLLDFGADASIENVYKKRALHYADATTQERIHKQTDTRALAHMHTHARENVYKKRALPLCRCHHMGKVRPQRAPPRPRQLLAATRAAG